MSAEKSFSGCRDGSPNFSEPVAKRTRSAGKKLLDAEKPKVEDNSSDEPTILNVLNEDCWRVLLDYVNLRDLVRSKRVSRCWRSMVQCYLQGIRLSLRSSIYMTHEPTFPLAKCRVMAVPFDYFIPAVKKFGRAIIAADCRCAAGLRALSKHCPNIEEIKIHEPQYHNLKNKIVPFNKLRRISIEDVNGFNDRRIAKFLGYTSLEELEVYDNDKMTGVCLSELKANLKSLELQSCKALKIDHLVSASDRLSDLTKLELNSNPLPILENLHKLIERTPKLEYLDLGYYETTAKVGALVEAICRLSRLRHLSLFSNNSVTDQWLEAVGRCCGELRTVSVGDCENVTAAGVVALCHGAGHTLVALDASYNEYITEDDVARCISCCPKLEILDVQYSSLVARPLPAAAAAVRRGGPRPRPLRLHLSKLVSELSDGAASPPMESCADLILDFGHNVFKCGDDL